MDTRIHGKGWMRALLPAVLAAGLAAGCGGGGGDDGGGGGGGGGPGLVAVPDALVAIDATLGDALVFGVVDGGSGTSQPPERQVPVAPAATGPAPVRPLFSAGGSQPCSGGGSVTISHGTADPATGPEIWTYNDCGLGIADVTIAVMNGQVIFDDYSRNDDGMGTVTTSVAARWNMFNTTFSDGTYLLLHGDITSTVVDTGAVVTVDSSITRLHFQTQGPDSPVLVFVVSNATTTSTTDNTAGTITTRYMFDLASNYWNGRVKVATLMDMVTSFDPVTGKEDPFPSSGQVLITGADGAAGGPTQARITFAPNQVTVEFDTDGDGNFEPGLTQTYTWADLSG